MYRREMEHLLDGVKNVLWKLSAVAKVSQRESVSSRRSVKLSTALKQLSWKEEKKKGRKKGREEFSIIYTFS